VLPGEHPLPLKQVVKGLYVAVNAYELDTGYFSQSPLYSREQGPAKPLTHAESAKVPARSPGQ
jgi:hypothetical protein